MHEGLICWDLDHTLGDFKTENDFQLRAGIDGVLKELSERGFTHVITTSATDGYAHRVLENSGLAPHFQRIFARDVLSAGIKRYSPVIEVFGITPDQAKRRMIVIGDQTLDQPGDLQGVVTVLQEDGYQHPAEQVKAVIELLLNNSRGSFNAGYWNLLSLSPTANLIEGVLVRLGNRTQYADPASHGRFPVIEILDEGFWRV